MVDQSVPDNLAAEALARGVRATRIQHHLKTNVPRLLRILGVLAKLSTNTNMGELLVCVHVTGNADFMLDTIVCNSVASAR